MDTFTEYDCFVSYALEDKLKFVCPLVAVLKDLGLECWYDEDKLIVENSLFEALDCGIARSKTGLLIFSKSFMEKPWSIHERSVLRSVHDNKEIRLIPILYGITHDHLRQVSPSLANLVCLDTSKLRIDEIVEKIAHGTRPYTAVDAKKKELYGYIDILVEQRVSIALERLLEQRLANALGREEYRIRVIEEMYQRDLNRAREIQRNLREQSRDMELLRHMEEKFRY
jgi:TIR domain-containing protein